MALPMRSRLAPTCTNCLQNHLRLLFADASAQPATSLRQQVRGKKKMVNNSGTLNVRLLKDVPTFGQKGAVVPIPTGQMRNKWFPQRIAEYVTAAEMKQLRAENIEPMRDFEYRADEVRLVGAARHALAAAGIDPSAPPTTTPEEEAKPTPTPEPVVRGITPQRASELFEIFVPARLDFWRTVNEESASGAAKRRGAGAASSAAADLLAARTRAVTTGQPIYGSLTLHEILLAIRAAMGTNDEAKQVLLNQSDLAVVEWPVKEGGEPDRLKHIGDYKLEVRFKGVEQPATRTIRVHPQL